MTDKTEMIWRSMGILKAVGINITKIIKKESIDPCLFDFKLTNCSAPQYGHSFDECNVLYIPAFSLKVHSV